MVATSDIESPIIVSPTIYATIKEFADKIRQELPSNSLEAAPGSTNEDILVYLDALESAFTPEES